MNVNNNQENEKLKPSAVYFDIDKMYDHVKLFAKDNC